MKSKISNTSSAGRCSRRDEVAEDSVLDPSFIDDFKLCGVPSLPLEGGWDMLKYLDVFE